MPNVKYFFRWLLRDGSVARVLRHPFFETVCPIVAGFYYLTLDVWGQEIPWIKDNLPRHQVAFFALAILTVLLVVLKGIGDWCFGTQTELVKTLESLIAAVGNIVTIKLQRFKAKSETVKPNSNVFEIITQPKEQIKGILRESQRFFAEQFEVTPEQFDITVIRVPGGTKHGEYVACANEKWRHTEPDDLLKRSSTAFHCLSTGEECFHANKKAAHRRGEYFASDRDERNAMRGSVYCTPVFIPLPDRRDVYLITFSSYGKEFCDDLDSNAVKAARMLFREFARRIELELTLDSIKKWIWESKKNSKSKGGIKETQS